MDQENSERDGPGGVITSIFGRLGKAEGEGGALTFLNRIPLQKITIWASFLGLLYILSDFFGVLIGTFVISYIGNSVVQRFQGQVGGRKKAVLLYFLFIVALITGLGFWTVTLAINESKTFINKVREEDPYILLYEKMAEGLPPWLLDKVEGVIIQSEEVSEVGRRPFDVEVQRSEVGFTVQVRNMPLFPELGPTTEPELPEGPQPPPGAEGPKPGGKGEAGDKKEKDEKGEKPKLSPEERQAKAEKIGQALRKSLEHYAALAITGITKFLGSVTKGFVEVIICLIFSFMIVWDLPNIKRGMKALERSRLGGAYTQVAPSVRSFGELLGRAFQAQTIIALVNTALTAVGMVMLGLPGVGFLSLVVFVCSFIPVAGVFISTAPMMLVSIASHGFGHSLLVVVMVIVVHAVEAYVLNPQIYSAHLKLHPLLVLVVLVFAEHTVGIWGLVVAVPFTVYIYRHVIMDGDRLDRSATTVSLVG